MSCQKQGITQASSCSKAIPSPPPLVVNALESCSPTGSPCPALSPVSYLTFALVSFSSLLLLAVRRRRTEGTTPTPTTAGPTTAPDIAPGRQSLYHGIMDRRSTTIHNDEDQLSRFSLFIANFVLLLLLFPAVASPLLPIGSFPILPIVIMMMQIYIYI